MLITGIERTCQGRQVLVVGLGARQDTFWAVFGRVRDQIVRNVLLGEVLRRREIILLLLSAFVAEVVLTFETDAASNAEAFAADRALPRRLFVDEFRLLTDLTESTGLVALRVPAVAVRHRRGMRAGTGSENEPMSVEAENDESY